SLRATVLSLLRLGATRNDLVTWAVETGYNESFVRSILSKVRCTSGLRIRAPGAGRRIPEEALALLALARERYGDRANPLLLAAYRAGKAEPVLQTISQSAA